MEISDIPFGTTDWSRVPETVHPGESGAARWRTREFGALRVRMVEYSPGYRADHWCTKGHILYVLDGVLETELGDGRKVTFAGDAQATKQLISSGAASRPSGTAIPKKDFPVMLEGWPHRLRHSLRR